MPPHKTFEQRKQFKKAKRKTSFRKTSPSWLQELNLLWHKNSLTTFKSQDTVGEATHRGRGASKLKWLGKKQKFSERLLGSSSPFTC